MLLARVKSGGRASTFRRGSNFPKVSTNACAQVFVAQVGLGRTFGVVRGHGRCAEQSAGSDYLQRTTAGVPIATRFAAGGLAQPRLGDIARHIRSLSSPVCV